MDKLEKFKQARGGVVNDLYLDNKPKEENNPTPIVKVGEVKQNDDKPILKADTIKEEKKETNKMLSFRIPVSLNEKLDHYSYMTRETKQDTIIKCFEKFFNSKEGKDVLEEYDKLKTGK